MPWLTITIFLPAVGAVLLVLLRQAGGKVARVVSLAVTVLTGILTAALLTAFNDRSASFQLADPATTWIPALGVSFRVGLDGISVWLFALTALLSIVAVLGAWTGVTERVAAFYACLLALETAMLGVFAALDVVVFYVFWEAMLVPMYFIIGVWGGEGRLYAAIKFLLYTLLGGVLMLAGVALLYCSLPEGLRTFSIPELLARAPAIDANRQLTLFLLFGIAFAIKVPLFPFHTWLPDAHVEAPTSGSIILAGVLLKMGAYGFIRFCIGMFPAASQALAPLMMWLAVVGIIYGGATAMWQRDIKRLVAYSSVSHLGFVMLGLFAFNTIGVQGAVLQMVNHGLSTGGLFLLVGMIYERRHTRMVDDYRGLWDEMPLYSRVFLVVALSSIGLPGLNGFVGEFMTLAGSFWSAHPLGVTWALLAATGVIIAACYMLWMFKRVFYGEARERPGGPMPDMRPIETTAAALLLVGIFWLGISPYRPVLRSIEPAAQAAVDRFEEFTGGPQTPVGATAPAGRAVKAFAVEAPEVQMLGGSEVGPEGGEAP